VGLKLGVEFGLPVAFALDLGNILPDLVQLLVTLGLLRVVAGRLGHFCLILGAGANLLVL
jgi:hypothetical protein